MSTLRQASPSTARCKSGGRARGAPCWPWRRHAPAREGASAGAASRRVSARGTPQAPAARAPGTAPRRARARGTPQAPAGTPAPGARAHRASATAHGRMSARRRASAPGAAHPAREPHWLTPHDPPHTVARQKEGTKWANLFRSPSPTLRAMRENT